MSPNLLKPYSRRELTHTKKNFNYRSSRARRCSVNAFGITVQGEEISQLRQELFQLKTNKLNDLRSAFDQSEAQKLNLEYQTVGRYVGHTSVNNMMLTDRFQPT